MRGRGDRESAPTDGDLMMSFARLLGVLPDRRVLLQASEFFLELVLCACSLYSVYRPCAVGGAAGVRLRFLGASPQLLGVLPDQRVPLQASEFFLELISKFQQVKKGEREEEEERERRKKARGGGTGGDHRSSGAGGQLRLGGRGEEGKGGGGGDRLRRVPIASKGTVREFAGDNYDPAVYTQLKVHLDDDARYLYAPRGVNWNPRRLPDRTHLAAYLVYWLCTFALPFGEEGNIRPEAIYPACILASGVQLALAPAALANIFRGLGELTSSPSPRD
ncbi:hypothetical protein Taro_011066 [Colocasia esculenta]|uniref:Aminotransferase-like plant mobile domain-containing protein n=1 Tax=Colocasia esculenta TaxID=4460 RepID=A0A843U9L8_COLES|nr:hypothetical protein [Colocasia esculenta]